MALLSGLFNELKDRIFPVHCLDCKKEGELVCENCFSKVIPQGIFCCPVCHEENFNGQTCDRCRQYSFLDQQISICNYDEENLISKIIEIYKYQFVEEAEKYFRILIKRFVLENLELFKSINLVVLVPLHKRRQAERGFNQAERIAKIIAEFIQVPVFSILNRQKNTLQQAKLSKEERKTNVQNAFVCEKQGLNGGILLVDDVFTTGSTLQECARAIKAESTNLKVIGFTIARA